MVEVEVDYVEEVEVDQEGVEVVQDGRPVVRRPWPAQSPEPKQCWASRQGRIWAAKQKRPVLHNRLGDNGGGQHGCHSLGSEPLYFCDNIIDTNQLM